jgi:phytol kinase
MTAYLIPSLLLACCFLALFGFAEWLYHRKNVPSEWTRKIVHFGTGILTLLFPVFLESHWQVLALCGSFLLLLIASLRFRFLPSINDIDRTSHGSILYPVVVYACFLLYVASQQGLIVFYLPILILAICDPVAALVGKRYPRGVYRVLGSKKTLSGSLAFFAVCILVTTLAFYSFDITSTAYPSHPGHMILIPMVAAAAEAVGVKGTDNLTIPASVAATLHLIL